MNNNELKKTPETYTPPKLTVVGSIEQLTQTGGHRGHHSGSVTDDGPKQHSCPWHRRRRWWCWWCN